MGDDLVNSSSSLTRDAPTSNSNISTLSLINLKKDNDTFKKFDYWPIFFGYIWIIPTSEVSEPLQHQRGQQLVQCIVQRV